MADSHISSVANKCLKKESKNNGEIINGLKGRSATQKYDKLIVRNEGQCKTKQDDIQS
jgi:hypothetical protein